MSPKIFGWAKNPRQIFIHTIRNSGVIVTEGCRLGFPPSAGLADCPVIEIVHSRDEKSKTCGWGVIFKTKDEKMNFLT